MEHTYTKHLFDVYLQFTLNCAPCIFMCYIWQSYLNPTSGTFRELPKSSG